MSIKSLNVLSGFIMLPDYWFGDESWKGMCGNASTLCLACSRRLVDRLYVLSKCVASDPR